MKTRAIAKAVWDGPFYIGPLSQPVSLGDVVLKLLETVWRTAVGVVALVVTSTIGIALWVMVVEPWVYPPAKDKVTIEVSYDDGSASMPPAINLGPGTDPGAAFRCTEDYPLKIRLSNLSGSPIGNISFSIGARRDGFTRNLIQRGNWLQTDRVLPPNTWWMNCWPVGFSERIEEPISLRFSGAVSAASYVEPEQ